MIGEQHLELIDGRICLITDMCIDSLEKAKANRERIASDATNKWWEGMERSRADWTDLSEEVTILGEKYLVVNLTGYSPRRAGLL